ncbi:hypothetical protein [Nannocystis punicea]|uniref:VWFA domain-containing protein n=1 Tax=Nannocystis punicea TaxID=2995304 RepID=A0ABY7HDC2_9BACT|nr:hypothetical protein [Nannocystis poenicansa]WAS96984.1 hypothetical protein O0S08_12615 [Nannocystis poenicansa]
MVWSARAVAPAFASALLLGLACGDSGTMASATTGECPVGAQGCPCTQGGGCDGELTCEGGVCMSSGTGTSGQETSTSTAPTTGGSESGGETTTTTATTAASPTTTSATTSDQPKLDVGSDTTGGPPAQGCTKIDMLFVLDGSGSMNEERAALAQVDAFTAVVDTLAMLGEGDIDYRIAVTTDNDDGYVTPNCWQEPEPWVSSVGHTPQEVAQAFACAVSGFGVSNFEAAVGCEHVLTSAVDLLDGDASGFVREDALLVLVLVTDVDDYGAYDQPNGNVCGFGCATGPTPLPELTQRLVMDVKKGEADGVAAIVVAGDPSVDGGLNFCQQPGSCGCNGIDCGAFHADRLWQFVGMLGANGYAADLCAGAKAVPEAVETALTESIDLACEQFEPPQ